MAEEENPERPSPFAETEKSAVEVQADLSKQNLSDEAKLLLESRQRLEKEAASHLQYPALNAFAARAAYFGVQGRLFASMDQISRVMIQSGPVGEAAFQRMNALAEKGWTFGALSPSDPYLKAHSKSTVSRWASAFTLGGYNDPASGRITHNSFMSAVNTVMGFSQGADLDAANKYIHELAHGKYTDGYLRYEASPAAKAALQNLSPEARKMHGALMIQEELRATVAQIASSKPSLAELSKGRMQQTGGLNNYGLEAALKQNQFGAMVKDVWSYEGSKHLSHAEANSAAKSYIKNTYGELFERGRMSAAAEKAIAAEIRSLPLDAPVEGTKPGNLRGTSPGMAGSPFSGRLSYGVQAAGGLLMLNSFADLDRQFRISTSSGIARLSSVGMDWAGFEAGAAAGTWMGEGLAYRLARSNPKLAMLTVPLSAMASGVFASQMTHHSISGPLENKLKKSIDELLQK